MLLNCLIHTVWWTKLVIFAKNQTCLFIKLLQSHGMAASTAWKCLEFFGHFFFVWGWGGEVVTQVYNFTTCYICWFGLCSKPSLRGGTYRKREGKKYLRNIWNFTDTIYMIIIIVTIIILSWGYEDCHIEWTFSWWHLPFYQWS